VMIFLAFAVYAEWVNSPNCGLRNEGRRNLITNGQMAHPYMFPWQVGLKLVSRSDTETDEDSRIHVCGGAILNEDWILTAAHCVSDDDLQMFNPKHMVVISGDYNYSSDDTDVRQVVDIETFIIHENYNDDSDNDIALIKLKEPLTLSSSSPWKVNPICLPTSGSKNYGEEILASGWGMFDDTVHSGDQMYWNSFMLRNDEYCMALKGGANNFNAANSICFDRFEPDPDSPNAKLYDTGEGVCRGDSGGSAVQQRSDGRFYTEGIASGVIFCGNLLSTITYAETRTYVGWIDEKIGNYDPANNPTFDEDICNTRADEVESCRQIYIGMNCPGSHDLIPNCLKKNVWMFTCGIYTLPENCNEAYTEISKCGKSILENHQNAYLGSYNCHESCETCGYYSTVGNSFQKSDDRCITCPFGYEIEPAYDDCRGTCVPHGEAAKTHECPILSNSPPLWQCVREPNADQEETEWIGDMCSESQITNVFSYAYCGGSPRGSCDYPIDPNACAEGFAMCKQASGDYRCYPVDGVGEPRICEQCFLDHKTYFHGECHTHITDSYIENNFSGPDGVTALFAGDVNGCAEARSSVQKQINCVKQQSRSDCCSDVNCKWSETAQLCYWETMISLNDSIICADSNSGSFVLTSILLSIVLSMCLI